MSRVVYSPADIADIADIDNLGLHSRELGRGAG